MSTQLIRNVQAVAAANRLALVRREVAVRLVERIVNAPLPKQ